MLFEDVVVGSRVKMVNVFPTHAMGYGKGMMEVGDEGIVTKLDDTSYGGFACVQVEFDGTVFYYAAGSLEQVPKTIGDMIRESMRQTLAEVTPEDEDVGAVLEYEVGDVIRVLTLDKTEEEFGLDENAPTIGDEYTIDQVDLDDNSVQVIGSDNWLVFADIELVPEVDEVAEVEGPTEKLEPIELSLGADSYDDRCIEMCELLGSTVEVITRQGAGLHIGTRGKLDDFDEDDLDFYVIPEGSTHGEWVLAKALAVVQLENAITAVAPANYIVTPDSITLEFKGRTDVITIDTVNFMSVRTLIIDGYFDQAQSLMNPAAGIANWGQGSLQIEAGVVTYSGMTLTGLLVDKIIDMMGDEDKDFERFAKFLNLTMENEVEQTQNDLMDFAAHGKIDISEEGKVVAFKNVKSDYFDKHSGTFRNQVGDEVSMRRIDVDANRDNTCSRGLHVCSPTYLESFWGTSGRTMRVLVDPRDFVALPQDYNHSKARVCKYTVVEDVTDRLRSDFM